MSKALFDTISNLNDSHEGKISLVDCAMGGCYVTAKSVKCSINSDEVTDDKRFACEVTDTQ